MTGATGARGLATTGLVLSGGTFLLLGLFFTIATVRLAAELPAHLYQGLVRQSVSPAAALLVCLRPSFPQRATEDVTYKEQAPYKDKDKDKEHILWH